MNKRRRNGFKKLQEAYLRSQLSLARRRQDKASRSPRLARANYMHQTRFSNRLTMLYWQEQ